MVCRPAGTRVVRACEDCELPQCRVLRAPAGERNLEELSLCSSIHQTTRWPPCCRQELDEISSLKHGQQAPCRVLACNVSASQHQIAAHLGTTESRAVSMAPAATGSVLGMQLLMYWTCFGLTCTLNLCNCTSSAELVARTSSLVLSHSGKGRRMKRRMLWESAPSFRLLGSCGRKPCTRRRNGQVLRRVGSLAASFPVCYVMYSCIGREIGKATDSGVSVILGSARLG